MCWSTPSGRPAAAIGDWWASSSIWDKLDMAMTIVGFIPGLDVVSDAYFVGKAIVDVIQGKGSWADVAMNAAFLLAPSIGGAARPACMQCGSPLLTFLGWSAWTVRDALAKRLRKLLAKRHDTDKEFFNDLFEAKLKYITTRPYWNEPMSKPKLY